MTKFGILLVSKPKVKMPILKGVLVLVLVTNTTLLENQKTFITD